MESTLESSRPAFSAAAIYKSDFASSSPMSASPVGVWAAIGDRGADKNKIQSLVQLYEDEGKLVGKVVRLYHNSGGKCDDNPRGLCSERCPGELAGAPIEGMTLMWDFDRIGENKYKGKIIDPRDGAIYTCTINGKGDRLHVRGYIGIWLFGRTQIWKRLKPERTSEYLLA